MNISSFFRRRYAWFTIIFAFALGLLLGKNNQAAKSLMHESKIQEKIEKKRSENLSTPKNDGNMNYNRNEKSMSELLGAVSKHRRELRNKLQLEFGPFSTHLLNTHHKLISMDDPTRERLIRRLIIKILAAQLNIVSPGQDKSTFTWVSAGDSVAAGHGNLLSQSYTAVLENTVKETFKSIGIDFVAKNRGMGGYDSAAELSFCMESVYGSDIDILSWDFGLTDRGKGQRISLWGNRAGIHPTKPIIMLIDDRKSERWKTLQEFEKSGMGAILLDKRSLTHSIILNVPDMSAPVSEKLPFYLKNIVCNGHIEGRISCDNASSYNICNSEKDSVCLDNKFHTIEECKDSKYQTSWNPGMKYHYMKGRIIGYFILEMLNEALLSLDSMKHPLTIFLQNDAKTDNDGIFQNLQLKERNDELSFHRSATVIGDWSEKTEKDTLFDINPSILFRAHSICHTALLPSQLRYDNILNVNVRNENAVPGGNLQLTFDPLERQECEHLEIDYKDYFVVEDLRTVTVPDDKEMKAYGTETTKKEGLILICLRKCPGDICPANLDNSESFDWSKQLHEGNIEIEVDHERVFGVKEWEGCYFLEGSEGLKWGRGQKENYEIMFKVNKKDQELQISSIIIF